MRKILISIIILFFSFSFFYCGSEIKRKYRRAKLLSKSEDMEDWEKAIKEFDEIIKMKVNAREYQGFLYRKLGKRHMEMEHWNDALKYFKKAIEIIPNEALLYYYIGICYSQLTRSTTDPVIKVKYEKKAESNYKMAISLNPKLAGPYYGLGIIYFYVYDKPDKAIEYMKEVLRLAPRDIDAHFALARFHYEIGQKYYDRNKIGKYIFHLNESLKYYKALLSIVPEKDERYEQIRKNIDRINTELHLLGG